MKYTQSWVPKGETTPVCVSEKYPVEGCRPIDDDYFNKKVKHILSHAKKFMLDKGTTYKIELGYDLMDIVSKSEDPYSQFMKLYLADVEENKDNRGEPRDPLWFFHLHLDFCGFLEYVEEAKRRRYYGALMKEYQRLINEAFENPSLKNPEKAHNTVSAKPETKAYSEAEDTFGRKQTEEKKQPRETTEGPIGKKLSEVLQEYSKTYGNSAPITLGMLKNIAEDLGA